MEATPTNIIGYFNGFKQNVVPLFQRPYTWTSAQWKTLWSDVISFYGSDIDQLSTHFMGAVVTMPARSVPVGVSKFLVIDGQQRLTTIAILLCAIRDSLASNEDATRRRIQHHYLTNDGYDGQDIFKLLPTQGDRQPFSTLVQGPTPLQDDSPFTKAYRFFCQQIKGLDDDGLALEPRRLLEIIENRLMVVMINLSDTDDPYLIFESLNFKGSPLEQADLVRNYFLMRFPLAEQEPVYRDLWLPMQNRLGSTLTEFMRHFLGAEGQEVRKGDVYAGIKRLSSGGTASTLKLLMTRMERLSVLYSRIATLTVEPNTTISVFFKRFERLDFGTVYPLLLALYEDFEDAQFSILEFVKCLAILDSYIVRRMVVRVPSNSLSGYFISLCKIKPVGDNPSTWLEGILARESKNRRWPTDGEFLDNWISTPIYLSRRVTSVILECLDLSFGHHELVDFSESSVEHIMPQTTTGEWLTELGLDASEMHAKWLHTIGNLTLTGYNPELSNKPYAEKKKRFASSHFEINKYFADVSVWNASAIQARASSLFSMATDIWPRPAIAVKDDVIQIDATPANFHGACIALTEIKLGISLSKLSQTRYETGDHSTRLVCAVSSEYDKNGEAPNYWFALHESQIDFLASAPTRWLCFGCGSANQTLLIPLSLLQPLIGSMSMTVGDGRKYWHVMIVRKKGHPTLRLLGGVDGPDLTSYSLNSEGGLLID